MKSERKRAKTKIIATLGPASNSPAELRRMFKAGLDIARLNFSHGNLSQHLRRIELIRRLNKKMGRRIRIMQDLEGYRIRVGELAKPILLNKKDQFYLTQKDISGKTKEVPFDYKGSLRRIKTGSLIYIDDGKIVLKVKKSDKQRIKVVVLSGGKLKTRKGINIPGFKLNLAALTDKDREDVKVAVDYRLDYVAQSFVSNARDINLLKEALGPSAKCNIFSKVENRNAIANIDEIIEASDGIIIARGDLGVSVPIYKVPIIQKEIIKKCRLKNKPVVVATQMLDSMIEELIPTRAEVNDVANAILDRATHLLLSGETAVGKHPHKAVEMMNKIIKYTESFCMVTTQINYKCLD